MNDITEQLSEVIRRMHGIANISEDDSYELQDIAIDLEIIRDDTYEVKHGRQPGEVPALCLWCGSEFWHSQGHTCGAITYYYQRSTVR